MFLLQAYVRDVQSVNLEELWPFTDHSGKWFMLFNIARRFSKFIFSAIIEKVQIQSELVRQTRYSPLFRSA